MKRGDISSIVGAFVVFITFLLSISLLNYFIQSNYDRGEQRILYISNIIYEKLKENIEFLNNETSSSDPEVIIKNKGKSSIDLSCFKVYVDGQLSNYTYYINEVYVDSLLNPGENATIELNPSSPGYHKIGLVSCNGNRFETIIYYI